jgi:hypothetical protein
VTWTLIAICYIILSQVSSVSDEEVRAGYSDIDVRNLGYATACLYALQPCPIAILWIILYGGPIKVKFRSILGYGKKKTGGAHDEENIDDLSPQLNEALREEIVEYLKFGFDALFNTEFEKTRDPHKDQITIHIDPSEALRDDDDDDVDSKRNSVTSQMSNWWSGKDHHHHHHHHTNSTSSTPVSTTTMNAAKMVCLVFHSFFFFSHDLLDTHKIQHPKLQTHNTTPTLQVYRDSVYQPPETPDIPSSVSDDTATKPKSTEMKDVVVVVKELDGDEEEKEGKEEKTSSRKSPAKMLRVDDKAVDESSVMMPKKLNKTASPSMLRRHLSAAGDDGLLEDILITAGGASNTRSHVVFQEKLTSIFQDFRKKLGIEKTFRSEMRQISAGMETNGRSGSFFFFTQRKLFCLKTMSKKEFEVLTRLVKPAEGSGVVPYTEYVLANRKTLIVRILGAYKLTMNDYGNSLYLYVTLERERTSLFLFLSLFPHTHTHITYIHTYIHTYSFVSLRLTHPHTHTGTAWPTSFHHQKKESYWEKSTTSRDQQVRDHLFVLDRYCIVDPYHPNLEHCPDVSIAVKSFTSETIKKMRAILV